MYKAQLVLVTAAYKECLEEEYSSSDDQKQNISKAEKLIAAGHMEPVNEILKLSAQVEADKRLIEAQKNMIEQLEGELKQLKQ